MAHCILRVILIGYVYQDKLEEDDWLDIKLGYQAGAKCEQNNLAWYTKNWREANDESATDEDCELWWFEEEKGVQVGETKLIKEQMEKQTTNKNKTQEWLMRCVLKVAMEALICAAQEQVLRTNYIKNNIDKRFSNVQRMWHKII